MTEIKIKPLPPAPISPPPPPIHFLPPYFLQLLLQSIVQYYMGYLSGQLGYNGPARGPSSPAAHLQPFAGGAAWNQESLDAVQAQQQLKHSCVFSTLLVKSKMQLYMKKINFILSKTSTDS